MYIQPLSKIPKIKASNEELSESMNGNQINVALSKLQILFCLLLRLSIAMNKKKLLNQMMMEDGLTLITWKHWMKKYRT